MKRLEPMFGRMPEFGGAATFLEVLRNELLPAIDAAYRTETGRRMLFGVSASGCFAAFALLTQPGLFSDYIIASPGLPAGIFRMEAAWAEAHDDLPARVLLSAGELELQDPFNIFSGAMRLTEDLVSRGYPGLQLETLIVPGASHVETVAPSLSRALSRLGGA
jgi:predicted alpha/beta superfamily hydrolase